MCDVFGAVNAAAYEQEENGDDHVWMHHPTNSATDTFSAFANRRNISSEGLGFAPDSSWAT